MKRLKGIYLLEAQSFPLIYGRPEQLPNVILTPHIAGSHAGEIRRLGRYMVDELERYVRNEPLRWQITRDLSARLA